MPRPLNPLSSTTAAKPFSGRLLVFLICLLVFSGLFLYARTLRMSFAYDDIDFVNSSADVFAGKASLLRTVFSPNGEHLIPILRLAFLADLRLFGADARPLRLVIFLAHLASGLFLSLLARHYLPAPWVAPATGLVYVGAGGFSSLWIWEPCGGGVPLGLVGVTGAMLAIAARDRLGPKLSATVAVLGVFWSLLCESTLAPLAVAPILLYERDRRRGGARRGLGPVSLVLLGLIGIATLWTASVAVPSSGRQLSLLNPRGVLKAGFLLGVSAYRLLFPGTFLPRPAGIEEVYPALSCLFGLTVAAALAALLISLARAESRELKIVALLSGIGPVGVVALVGIGRFRVSVEDLYYSDRYFFTLLIPLSLLAAVGADGVRAALGRRSRGSRLALRTCLVAFLGAELLLHRWAVVRRVPFHVYEQHGSRFRQLALLADRLDSATKSLPSDAPPISFPDSSIAYNDVHNGHLTTRVLLFAARPTRATRLALGGRRVSARDEAFLNPILEGWARDIGEPVPYLMVQNGLLVNARDRACADFRADACERTAHLGLYPWEGTFRWMGAQAELQLTLSSSRVLIEASAPWSAIHARFPDWRALTINVTLEDPVSGRSEELGSLEISGDAAAPRTFVVAESFVSEAAGHVVTLRLMSDRTWRPLDLWPTSPDRRALSVQLSRAGFCQ
jgi:hypothetical protein